MFRIPNVSLRLRLFLLVLLTLLPLLALVLYNTSQQRAEALAAASQQAQGAASLAATNIAERLQGQQQLLASLAQAPAVLSQDAAGCSAMAAALLSQFPLYTNIGAANVSGDVFCASVAVTPTTDVSTRPWFQQAAAGRAFVLGGYQVSARAGLPVAVGAYPARDPSGALKAVVFAALDLSQFNALEQSAALPPASTVTVMDGSGTILSRYPDAANWVGKSLPENPFVKTVLAQTSGTAQMPGLDNVERLYSFVAVNDPIPGLHVAVGIPTAAAFAEANAGLTRGLFGLGLGVLLALAVAGLVAENFVLRPVHRLVSLTRRVASGEASARSGQVFNAREFDELAKSFDGLLDAVQQREAELEQRVATRTAALEREVAERKQAEAHIQALNESLRRRATELEAANRELEAFSYSVSHDLRAPLRSIDGFSLALLEDYGPQLTGNAQDYLQRVRAAAQRMAELIDDLLNLSRVTRAELRYETINLSEMAQGVAAELRSSNPGRQAEIAIAPGLTAQGDGRLLGLALANLLGNAWKFTSRRENAHIEFGANGQNGRQVFFVRDDGAGFDMAYVQRLFAAFQRLHDQSEYSGNGIGLATVQRIIRRHGGKIWAEGQPNQGATFYFTIGHEHER